MYSQSDPRSKLTTAQRDAQAPYAASAPSQAFAPAEYIKFHELEPQEEGTGHRTWYARGQNFVLAYTEVTRSVELRRDDQPDEYMLLIPDRAASVLVTAGDESRDVDGYSLSIVPPGRSRVVASPGVFVRVFTTASADLLARCANAASYAQPHPHVGPLQLWPAPPAGYRLRTYSLDVPPQEGRFGRIWRCRGLMINVLPREHGPRDLTRLSPHHHDDFEQCSLALEGAFTHHIRWPWTPNFAHWRADEHEACPAPSMAVIPPPAIHTSAASDPGTNQLIDIFAPPRLDFSRMPGWVLNAEEYPLP